MLLKTQFEIRYTAILDFASRYKSIVSPFLKLSTFSIQDLGMLEEHIQLGFTKDSFTLDLRWDRMIFTTQVKISNLYEKSGPTSSYFEIFERLKALDSFGQVQNIL